LASSKSRVVLGISGKPGVGKSSLSRFIVETFGQNRVCVVPMDGFHLSNRVLEDMGIRDCKGAPETFDASGFVSLLSRIRAQDKDPVYFPIFNRAIEESIAAQGVLHQDVQLVLVEGNYLNLESEPWNQIIDLLDDSWFLTLPEEIRIERLVTRHEAFGKSRAEAIAWANGSDQRNAELIERSRHTSRISVEVD
jgi:pantothenate kinase